MAHICFCALLTAVPRIKHVVVLFEENRAFDHFLGHHTDLHVDGLKGDESNPIFLSDPSKGNITVFDGAPYVSTAHPQHGHRLLGCGHRGSRRDAASGWAAAGSVARQLVQPCANDAAL